MPDEGPSDSLAPNSGEEGGSPSVPVSADEKDLEEALRGVPSPIRRQFQAFMSLQARMVPPSARLMDKLTPENITQALQMAENAEARDFQESRDAKILQFVFALLGSVLFIFVTVFLVPRAPDLYKEALKDVALFLGGLGIGYGFKRATKP